MIKKITVWFCLTLLLLTAFQTVSADAPDGQYDVKVRLLKAYQDEPSMGGNALKSNAKLYVKNGQGHLRIEFKSLDFMDFTGYLGNLSVDNQTVKIIENYAVFDEYNHPENGVDSVMKGVPYPKILEFPVDITQNIIKCSVYVPVMGEMGAGQQKARIEITYPEAFNNLQSAAAPQQSGAVTAVVEAEQTTAAAATTTPQTTAAKATTVPQTTAAATTEALQPKQTKNAAADNQAIGYYHMPVALWNANEDKPSMGDNAIAHTADLVVSGDQMKLYVGAAEMSIMNITTSLVDLYYDDGQQYRRAEAYDYSLKIDDMHKLRPRLFMVPISSKVKFLDVMVDPKVEPMGEQPIKARLKLDFAAAKQIDKQQAQLLLASETGKAKPSYDQNAAVTRSDKGIVLQAPAGTFTADFNFYADALHGEALTEIEQAYADQLPKLASVSVYKIRALGDLTAIPYTADVPINDLREAFLPQGDFQLTLPVAENDRAKNLKLYALEDNLVQLDYTQSEESVQFSYDKFVPFALVAENSAVAVQQVDNQLPAKSAAVSQASSEVAATAQVVPSRLQVYENPAVIMLSLAIILLVLGGAIYFTMKYYKIVLAELDYSAELKRERVARMAREEHRQ